jgi:hypothetical protein
LFPTGRTGYAPIEKIPANILLSHKYYIADYLFLSAAWLLG